MDIVLPTHYRPDRLNSTLSGLLLQKILGPARLLLVENGDPAVTYHHQINKLITAFRNKGWHVEIHPCGESGISAIKQFGMSLVQSAIAILLDNDVIFTRHDTLSRLEWVLQHYDVAVASPLAYDIDSERPVLNEYAHLYGLVIPDDQCVSEGNVALGLCLAIVKEDYEAIKELLCPAFPYLEDQILVHFLKKRRGYAFLHDHIIYHVAYAGDTSYQFDDEEVIRLLERKTTENPDYGHLLELRRKLKDGAEFNQPIRRSSQCET